MKRILALLSVVVSAGAGAAFIAASPGDATTPELLFVNYRAARDCVIYPNFPKAGVIGNAPIDIIPAGQILVWRYNADSTWSVVRDPARAAARQFPWWGFTRTRCIGNSVATSGRSRATHRSPGGLPLRYPAGVHVPTRLREARGSCAWVPVQFTVTGAHITRRHHALDHNATLRDSRHLVIGNIPKNWHVDVTDHTLPHGWTEVYVPNSKRWGYLLTSALR